MCYNTDIIKKGEKQMNLYAVIIDNGAEWAEDYTEKIFGVFDSREKAETYATYVVGEGARPSFEKCGKLMMLTLAVTMS